MAKKINAYLDTGAFIAFLDKSDTYHSLFSHLFSNPPLLTTTPLVIAEGHGWFLRRYDAHRGREFLNFISELKKQKILNINEIGAKAIEEASKIIKKYSDQNLTLADACGLWMIKKLKIKSCWSVDRHLGLASAPLIIHEHRF